MTSRPKFHCRILWPYLISLLPSLSWLPNYNLTWFYGDVVAELPINIIKDIPTGFGNIGAPPVSVTLWQTLLPHAPGLFLAQVLEHLSIAKNFSSKAGYSISASQELVALGACNITGSFFTCFTSAGSLSRGAVLARSGVQTPLAGILIGLIALAGFSFLTPCFYYIPNAALAAVILRAAISLLPGYTHLKFLWCEHKIDFCQCLCAMIGTFFLGVVWGITLSLILTGLFLFLKLARPKVLLLEKLVCKDFRAVGLEPGFVAFSTQESLFFLNAGFVCQKIISKVIKRTSPNRECHSNTIWTEDIQKRGLRIRKLNRIPESSLTHIKAVIIDLSSAGWIDTTGLTSLKNLQLQLSLYHGATLINTAEKEEHNSIESPFSLHIIASHPSVYNALIQGRVGIPFKDPSLDAGTLSSQKLATVENESVYSNPFKHNCFIYFNVDEVVFAIHHDIHNV
ncbi:hypothetical protein DSO57_1031101 [Entomophthora muscae]|uniref:Uncharacterized protein n=1 Tax=Entomophthora muscae TaxID=34485 RepID=A0ACC2RFG2_9FUNG|nr:hypothetical protein DSO57_1031101 [Entomophthora muscae]